VTRLLISAALALALGVAACGGDSAEDRALSNVCSARTDIKKQVDELKSTTISSGALDGVQANLSAIQKDVKQIANNQGKLADDRKQEVQKANQAFKSQVSDVARAVVSGVATGSGQDQIKTALDALAAAYQSAFAPIKCD
jgi:hypothetical protein